MKLGTVAALWRYPVKSMAGERLDSARISYRGIPGDRGWAVFDESRGGVTTAKRLPPLRTCTARYAREPVAGEASPVAEIRMPDGTLVASDSPEAAVRLGALVGRPVSMRALGPAGSADAPRLTSAGEPEEVFRALMGVLPDEPMPDLSAFTPERMRLLRQGNFFDALPLHLITRTTLATLARTAPELAWDERRFRANLLVDATATEGYPEMEWIGRRVRAGEALLDIAMECPRCVMVTQAVDELPHDPRVMRTLVRETKHAAGVYVSVVEEGDVRVGDALTLE